MGKRRKKKRRHPSQARAGSIPAIRPTVPRPTAPVAASVLPATPPEPKPIAPSAAEHRPAVAPAPLALPVVEPTARSAEEIKRVAPSPTALAPEPTPSITPVAKAAAAAVPAIIQPGGPEEPKAPPCEAEPVPEYAAEDEPPPPEVEAPAMHVRPSLHIVQITPELAPVAKAGGLADVVFGLSREIQIRGNTVEIILPKYDTLRYDHIWGLTESYKDLWVPWGKGSIHCTVYYGEVHGARCFFIEPHSGENFFNRGAIYGSNDDVFRFAFFSRAAMEFLLRSERRPDIIHCHDWQTALVPVLLYEIYVHLGMGHSRVCFTIHNFKHQGTAGVPLLHASGLERPDYFFSPERLLDNHNRHAINLMKGGIVYANFVTTVSPRHASEARGHGQGFGLEPTLSAHQMKYGGVLNGIDYDAWNPREDPLLVKPFSVIAIDGKYDNKRALRHRLMLADNEKPIVAFIGRLDPQKGLELVRHAIFYTLQHSGQFVLLGKSADAGINGHFWQLKKQLNDSPDCHLEIDYNEELAHQIYAGSDIMLVPSRFEPCGLTQLIAMRYGSVPVVREVGGLADTVFDKDFSSKPLHERNGYVFMTYDNRGLETALGRALACYYQYPEHFRELMLNGMRGDFSWTGPGQHYMNIYDYIRNK
jgi:starch synthase